jgi:hypothetical protein
LLRLLSDEFVIGLLRLGGRVVRVFYFIFDGAHDADVVLLQLLLQPVGGSVARAVLSGGFH